MPKKKSGNPRYMLSAKRKEQLKDRLRAYKANPPLSDLAREYKVSHSTVSWHWRKVQAERKAKHATVKSVKDYNPKIMGQLAQATGTTLMTSSSVKPNGHIAVTIAQEWLKPIVEEVARTEIRDFLQTAFRK